VLGPVESVRMHVCTQYRQKVRTTCGNYLASARCVRDQNRACVATQKHAAAKLVDLLATHPLWGGGSWSGFGSLGGQTQFTSLELPVTHPPELGGVTYATHTMSFLVTHMSYTETA